MGVGRDPFHSGLFACNLPALFFEYLILIMLDVADLFGHTDAEFGSGVDKLYANFEVAVYLSAPGNGAFDFEGRTAERDLNQDFRPDGYANVTGEAESTGADVA
jgi:hypothetical protein